MGCKVGLIIYSILQFLAFLFVLVATPIDMFRAKGHSMVGNNVCYTLWGLKLKCYSTKYEERLKDMFPLCKDMRYRFRAAEAFAIISIVVYLIACVFGFVQLCCCACFRWVCLVLNIFGIAAGCIPWALMANAYYKMHGGKDGDGKCGEFKTIARYGSGFALFVVGWALNTINIVFLMLPC